MRGRFYFILFVIAVLCILLAGAPGCIKEYSYEKPAVDSISQPDSTDTLKTTAIYSQCPECEKSPEYESGKWSFTVDTFSFCGKISNAVMLSERTAFTFFGPSACSTDSGLIITCYLDKPFDAEAKNVVVNRTTLRYYNHLGTRDMFDADVSLGFFLIIESYSATTGIMKGNFGGLVTTDRDDFAQIANGKFVIQF